MTQELNIDAIRTEYNKLVKLYSDIESINEEIKQVCESLKLEGADVAEIVAYAKAFVKGNTDKLVAKADKVITVHDMLSN